MAIKKEPKFKVIRNPQLVRAGQAFIPVFGNDYDRNLVNRIIEFEKELGTVNNETLRYGKNHTKKMSDLLFTERCLIEDITRRNNDF